MKASTRTVYLPRRICHTTSEKEITLENPLPDLSPDISRLIRAEATAYPEQTEAGKDGVTVSGRVVFGLLYETDYKNKLAHASMTTDFAQRFVLDGFTGGALAHRRPRRVPARQLPPALAAQGAAALPALLFDGGHPELRGAEVLSPEAKESDTFFQTTLIESERWIDPVEAVYSFSERIECPKPIGTILSKTLTLSPPEVFEREGVVVVNSNAHYTALVEEENTDNAVFAVMRTLRFRWSSTSRRASHFHAELRVATLDASAELNDYGENKIMAVSFSVDARLKGYANEPLELVTDAFNSNYENHIRTDSLYYDIPVFAAERSFTVEKTVETDANLLEVLDTIATVSVASTVKEEGGLRVRGNIAYSVLAIADYGVTTIDSVEPFDELFPANTPEGDVDYYSFGYPLSASSALVGSGTVGTKVVVMLSIFGFEKREVTVAAELTMEESAKDEFADEAVIYYYPDRDETLWNVAKQYSVNPALLRSDNESAFDESDHVRARMLRICKK